MSDTIFARWNMQANNLCLFIAEDEPVILEYFQECLGGVPCEHVNMDDFSAEMISSSDVLRIAIMDGTLLGEDWDAKLPKWLEKRNLHSDYENNLVIIGFSGDNDNRTSLCHRWYLKGATPKTTTKFLVELCKKTAVGEINIEDWPNSLPNPISDLIHSLDNLLTPVRLDSETLRELIHSTLPNKHEQLTKAYEDVWNDHLCQGSTGYLGSTSTQHKGKDAISFVNDIVQELGNGTITKEYENFRRAVQDLQLTNIDMNKSFSALVDFENGLRRVYEAGFEIVVALRELRNKQNAGS